MSYFAYCAFSFSFWRFKASIAKSIASSNVFALCSEIRSLPGMCSVMVATLFPLSKSLSSLRTTSAPVERSAKRSIFPNLCSTNSTNLLSASNFTV